MKKVYISGKITGLDINLAKSNFEAAELLVLADGSSPVNPMKIIEYDPKLTWDDYMIADIRELFKCQEILMLPNWGDSRGARIERAIAMEMGINIKYL